MLFCMWQRTGYPRVVEQLVSIHAQCMPKSWVLFLNTSPYMCSAYCNCQVWILYMRCVLLVVISSSLLVMCRVHNTLRVLRMKWSEYGIFNLTYFFGVELSINWCWYHDAWTVIFFWCWGEDFDHGSTIRTTMLLVVAPKVEQLLQDYSDSKEPSKGVNHSFGWYLPPCFGLHVHFLDINCN